MLNALHDKGTYLTRVIYAGVLYIGLIGSSLLPTPPVESGKMGLGMIVGLVFMVLLGFLCMKVISEVLGRLTGMSFFLSPIGMVMLFMISTFLAIFITPLYFGFNLLQFFRAKKLD